MSTAAGLGLALVVEARAWFHRFDVAERAARAAVNALRTALLGAAAAGAVLWKALDGEVSASMSLERIHSAHMTALRHTERSLMLSDGWKVEAGAMKPGGLSAPMGDGLHAASHWRMQGRKSFAEILQRAVDCWRCA